MKDFLEKYMKNSVSRYLAVYINEIPSVEDLRRFEDAMGTDLSGISDEDYESWATEILGRNNYMIYRIFIEQDTLKVTYITEVEGEEMDDFMSRKEIEIIPFEKLWKNYVATDKEIYAELNSLDFLSTEEINELLDKAEQRIMEISNKYNESSEQQSSISENIEGIINPLIDPVDILSNIVTNIYNDLNLREELETLAEENEILQDTIKDMEAIIHKYEIELNFLYEKLKYELGK